MSCWPLKVLPRFNPTHGLIRLLETDDAVNGRLSVNMWTISMPARSMSCIMVFMRDER